ncbi:MAG: diphthine synthase [archaeon]
MIGIGLSDETDITVKGLEAVKKCSYIYLENYTSKLGVPVSNLERLYDKKIILADRNLVENKSDDILSKAVKNNVAFLIIGDVFSATTHVDLFLRAKEKKINIKVIHNTSIMTAVGQVGLELYKYGKTTSMSFFEHNFMPETPYNVVKQNLKNGLHTLVLLDIKKDQDKYMKVNIALKQFMELEDMKKGKVFSKNMLVVGCARLGSEDSVIKYGKIQELLDYDFGEPLHCLIIPGKLHFMEEEMLELWT